MRYALILILLSVAAMPASSMAQAPSAQIETRRVAISLTFSGQQVFLFGRVTPGTERILAVMEGPSAGEVRLMEEGRVVLFWLGVRQYKLTGVPGIYLINTSGPACSDGSDCTGLVQRAAWEPNSTSARLLFGLESIRDRAHVESLSGPLAPGEAERVVEGYWQLQARRDLYAIRNTGIQISHDGVFYHRFSLPTQAPEGKYRILTYFFGRDRLLGTAENQLFVRKSGFVAWLTRLAERQAITYGILTVGIALAAGWLAGTIFKRGGGH